MLDRYCTVFEVCCHDNVIADYADFLAKEGTAYTEEEWVDEYPHGVCASLRDE